MNQLLAGDNPKNSDPNSRSLADYSGRRERDKCIDWSGRAVNRESPGPPQWSVASNLTSRMEALILSSDILGRVWFLWLGTG